MPLGILEGKAYHFILTTGHQLVGTVEKLWYDDDCTEISNVYQLLPGNDFQKLSGTANLKLSGILYAAPVKNRVDEPKASTPEVILDFMASPENKWKEDDENKNNK